MQFPGHFFRTVTLLSIVLSSACKKDAVDAKIIGSWEWQADDVITRIDFRRDHTFTISSLVAAEPGSTRADNGSWNIQDHQLVFSWQTFHGKPAEGKQTTATIEQIEAEVLRVRAPEGTKIDILKRLK